jgi:glutamate N-acetyltransferase/amino-acid N-acetyltransferase
MNADSFIEKINGGVCAAEGVSAAAATAGIKESGNPDMTIIKFDSPAEAAGVFTLNKVCAAPVVLCRERVGKRPLRAILVNSGNANACTGKKGMADAYQLCREVATRLDCSEEEVVMSSTGLIGALLPMDKMEPALDRLVMGFSNEGGAAAAEAIMTTDTHPKEYAVTMDLGGKSVRIGGMTKGAGMIAPNMATMLAYITTDAAVSSDLLARLLPAAVNESFNCVTIDGDTSTNDTVILAATGASGFWVEEGERLARFEKGLRQVCRELALSILRDGEGVTKVVEIQIVGAADAEEARIAGRSVSESLLVKTGLYGGLPNWGRFFAAAGYSGAQVDMDRMSLQIGEVLVVEDGAPIPGWEASLAEVLKRPEFTVVLGLGVGESKSTFWTTDISHDYVRINADYRT